VSFQPRLIIVHSISEYINGLPAKEFLESIGLSVHAFIHPNGDATEMIPSNQKSLHAGVSEWKGLEDLNQCALGVEVMVEGENTYGQFITKIRKPLTFTSKQYKSLVDLCAMWMNIYPEITIDDVVRHSDVSGKKVRPKSPKLDPGSGFDWSKFKRMLSEKINS
jgi:N-acetyl-anhydromuramyl-L-alanine amidase AmpD